MSGNNKKKLTLISLVLVFFTSVYGFGNMPRSYLLMGYGAIPWYILAAIIFFIPFALMIAEFASAFKDEKGGIYSWMEISVGGKYSFIATFMLYTSNLIWMVGTSTSIWVPVANLIFGSDNTQSWAFLGFKGTQLLGILGIMWILLVTFICTKGTKGITKVTSIGGIAVSLLNVILIVGGVLILALNKGVAEPLNGGSAFFVSPNPGYSMGSISGMLAVLGFIVYAIFAYGGIESMSGLVDETENPGKTFPKAVIVSALIISIGYSLGIFLIGVFTNWNDVIRDGWANGTITRSNITYIIVNNLGFQLMTAFGASQQVAINVGNFLARFVGLTMFLSYSGAFVVLSYSPLKIIMDGTPKKLWPKIMAKTKNGMHINALKIQCSVVVVFLFLLTIGGEGAQKFFDIITIMTNVAITIPYAFISIAYIKFKQNDNIEKPFEAFKSKTFGIIAGIIVTASLIFGNAFTIIEPLTRNSFTETFWSIVGPVIFGITAFILFSNYEKKYGKHGEDQSLKKIS